MKSKGIAVPYVIWMAIFVVAPLLIIVFYAFTEPGRRLHAGELLYHGPVYRRVRALLFTGHHRHRHLPAHRLSPVLLAGPGESCGAPGGHHAHHAAHVDELPAAHLLLDVPAGAAGAVSTALLGLFGTRPLPDDRHPGGHRAGHGLQLPALHDSAHPLRSWRKSTPRSSRPPRIWAPTPSRSFAG